MINLENTDPASLSPHQQEVIGKTIAEAQNQGIDPNYAIAIANQESAFNHLKDGKINCSDAGACGAFQLMPDVAKRLGVNPRNIDQNIKGGISLLKENLNRYDNNDLLATVAYNTSEATRNKFMETGDPKVLPKETLDYVRNIHSQHPLQGVLALGTENNPFLSDQPNPVVQEIKQEREQQVVPEQQDNYARLTPKGNIQVGINTSGTQKKAEEIMGGNTPEAIGAGIGVGRRLVFGPTTEPTTTSFPEQERATARVRASQDSITRALDAARQNVEETRPVAEAAMARAQELHNFIHETDPAFRDYLNNFNHYPTPEQISIMDQGRGSAADKLGTTGAQGMQFNENTSNRAAMTAVNKGTATPFQKAQAEMAPRMVKNNAGILVDRLEALRFHTPDRLQKKAALDEAVNTAQQAQAEHEAAAAELARRQAAANTIQAQNEAILQGASPSRMERARSWAEQRLGQMGYGMPKGRALGSFTSGMAGALAGHEADLARQRFNAGDYYGTGLAGLGALSGLAFTSPDPRLKALGTIGGAGTAGLEYLRNKYQNPATKP